MTEPAAMPQIDARRAAALADAGEVLLLDVREDDEWRTGRGPAAQHQALGQLDPAAIPRDRPVVAVCRSGNRSAAATQVLAAAGYDVHNLAGGMEAWAAAGLPVVRADGALGELA